LEGGLVLFPPPVQRVIVASLGRGGLACRRIMILRQIVERTLCPVEPHQIFASAA
jgi:hypothetical protein